MRLRRLALAALLAGCTHRSEPKAPPPPRPADAAKPAAPLPLGCAGLRACGAALDDRFFPYAAKLGRTMVDTAAVATDDVCTKTLQMRVSAWKADLLKLPAACDYDPARLAQAAGAPADAGPSVTPCGRLAACGRALRQRPEPAVATLGPDLVRLAERGDLAACVGAMRGLAEQVHDLPEACRP